MKSFNKKRVVRLCYGIVIGSILLCLILLYILQRDSGTSSEATPVEGVLEETVSVLEEAEEPLEAISQPVLPRLYFIIDDAGSSVGQVSPFLELPAPVTLAVLPGLRASEEVSRVAKVYGKSVILHQPMEAVGGQDPGPGAIYSGMSAEDVLRILTRNLEELDGEKGVNNHMGSRITGDSSLMRIIMEYLDEEDLFFVDSLTTADSIVRTIADDLGVPYLRRDVFLDNEKNREAILQQIEEGKETARQQGYAVMIGHAWCEELADLLTEVYPELEAEGFTIEDIDVLLQEEEL